METITTTCPFCRATHKYGAELAGRYTFCLSCGTRFYVQVPTPDAPVGTATSAQAAAKRDTTLDDLLLDTQQGSRHIIHSLRRLEDRFQSLRWLVIAGLLLVLATLATTLALLTSRS